MKPPLLLFAVLAASLLSPGCVPERPDHRPQIDGRVLDAQGALALNAEMTNHRNAGIDDGADMADRAQRRLNMHPVGTQLDDAGGVAH